MNYKILVTEFYYGFETAANERTRSVMLASAHAVYEVRRISCIYKSMRVSSWRCDSKVHVGISTGRLGIKACLPC